MRLNWRAWRLAAAMLLLMTAFAMKGALIRPPAAPAHAAAGEFDTTRAMARLQRILGNQLPHPVDSEANDAVRGRLMAELAAIGLEPRVRDATDCSSFPKSRVVSCSRVRNVVAVIGGGAEPALLLNAHYDSTPTGPGAADDGLGVATMLEVAQLLRAERLHRPVILLFNEGEEFGLNGAAAFVERDPLAARVGKLINIEARGVDGPAIMFETSSPNGAAIADYQAAARRPFANSISSDFAKLIPNSTDVVKFKAKGWETLSYSIIGNETRYHSPGDRTEALDRDSLHHVGCEVLAANRRLAGPDREAGGGGQRLFADIAGRVLVTLPLGIGAALLAGLALAAGLLVASRRPWRALGACAMALVGSIGIAALLASLAGLARAGDFWRAYPWVTTLAVAASVLAVQAWLLARAAGRHDRSQLRLAAWALILLAGCAASVALPGAIIFFLFGPALALAGMAVMRRSLGVGRALVWTGAALQLVLFTEIMALVELTLIDGPLWAVAPLAALAALPVAVEAARGASRAALGLVSIVAVALWAAALAMPRASAERPLAFTLDHVQDERTGKAVWAAATKQAPLPQGFEEFGPWRLGTLPYNQRKRWLADAPKVDSPRGDLTLVASRQSGKGRRVRLRLHRRGADAVLLRFPKDVPVVAMGLPGRLRAIDPEAEPGPSVLRCSGRRCDGLEVEVALGDASPVVAMLVAQRFAPPLEAMPLLALRPATAHPQYSPDSQVRVRAIRL